MRISQQLKVNNESVISGPFPLFGGSFTVEFLRPDPSRNATVLMRATYKHNHPLCKKGKKHPQAPPLHLHFDQSETFEIISGKVGTTSGWGAEDRVWTAEDGTHEIKPWVPHNFWPCPDSTEDTVFLIWAHPQGTPNPMDTVFFANLLMYVSDIHEGKASMDVLQIMKHPTTDRCTGGSRADVDQQACFRYGVGLVPEDDMARPLEVVGPVQNPVFLSPRRPLDWSLSPLMDKYTKAGKS